MTPKKRDGSKLTRRRSSSTSGQETEVARLTRELTEALEQQTATAEVLQVINSSPGDLAPVFDAMLEKAVHLCDAAFGVLWTYDGERFRAVRPHDVTRDFAEFLREPAEAVPGGMFRRLLAGEPIAEIVDIAESEIYRAGTSKLRRAFVDLGGARTALFVALRKDQALLGVFTIYRKEVRPFSDKQKALVSSFASQAVIAMENARLISETREALEQQTATAEVLRVINSSPGDLTPVFDSILQKAHSLCSVAYGSLHLYEDGRFRAVAVHGIPQSFADRLRQGFSPGPNHPSRPLLEGARFAHVPDCAKVDDPITRAAFDLGGIRTTLFIPLRKDDTLLGQIVAARKEVRLFTEKEIALLESFAAQAVIAIENARLLGELRERTTDLVRSVEELAATADVLRAISSSTGELDPVLTTLVETAARLCHAETAFIFRRDGDVYRVAASYGWSAEFAAFVMANPITPDRRYLTGRALLERRPVQILDTLADPDYWPEAKERSIYRTALGVPLLREGEPIGTIAVARTRVSAFTDKEIALVSTFADQAVIAIENARLLGELRDRSAELARSVDELTTLREVGQAVGSTLDLATVLQTIVTRAVALAGAEAGAIYRYRKSNREFRLGTFHGLDEQLAAKIRGAPIREEDTTALRRAIAERTPVQIPDLEAAPHLPLRNLHVAAGFRSVLIVPLVRADRVFGVLAIQKKTVGEFPESTVKLMQAFATQSVLAIQNARLFRAVEEQGQALALASQHKSQFLANMSHELRTPLNAILGYAELLVDGIYGELSEKSRDILERVQSNGKHLLGLINDVLDLSKIEAGQLTLAIDDYAMPAVVHTVASATESLAKAKGLLLATSVPRDLPVGRGDEQRLTQVLLNLVGNAIKFTDAGSVEISVSTAKDCFDIAVRDTGPGIAKADQARIFEEFQQVDSSSTRRKPGTGLGLSISKRIIEMHGGAITVDSERGKGSTFHVIIPVRATPVKEVA